jgi:DNA invertase Pin-like site-specific DNA recombinase
LLLSRKEKEKHVIKLAKEGKTYREIAKTVHVSPTEIKKILDKVTGDAESIQQDIKEKEKQKPKTLYAQAFQMFRNDQSLTKVVVELDIDAFTVIKYYEDYLALKRMNILVDIYPEVLQAYNWKIFYHLYRRIKEEGLNKQEITEILQNKNKLKDLYYKLEFYHKHISELKSRKLALEQGINSLRQRRDNYLVA